MKKIKNPIIEKKLSSMSRTVKSLSKSQLKIAKDMKEIATLMGISSISMMVEQEWDKNRTYEIVKAESIKDLEGNELLDIHLDYSELNDQFGIAFDELEGIEIPNSIDFITETKNKYDMIPTDEIEDVTFGTLAIHFLKRGIDNEVAGKFLERLFCDRDALPSDWWFGGDD